MSESRIIPVVLCGGSGSRLWPASRESYPKQFLALAGERTLLQDTVLRVADPARFAPPIIVANAEHRFIVAEQMAQIGVTATIALEPARKDSAAAIAAAARLAELQGHDQVILVLASDHVILNDAAFRAAVETGRPAAQGGRIVTFGAPPTEPTSRYGYIRPGAPLDGAPGVRDVAAFEEKPDRTRAEALLADGCLWNSGNFLCLARTLLNELDRYAPEIAGPARLAADKAVKDLDFLRLDAAAFGLAEAKSIDFAVMERTALAAVTPADFGWSDVGGWAALWEIAPHDHAGNALVGPTAAIDSSNCYVRSEKPMTAVVGMTDAVVVATQDAVMVTTRDRADGIKTLVAELTRRGEPTAVRSVLSHRPWGSFQVIDDGPRFQVNHITVKPKRRLSLHRHIHRAEHWIVVRGAAQVTLNGEERMLHENESVYVPIGVAHRLANPGVIPLEIIEVQTGSYLGEDDIVRLEDDYRR
ncbi:mannose-1-phosphate guanylyltransferase/mannose-6-phosphate isomerase [Methylopila jiangsuensis]|uniref:mannose-1-phosphate guanylyltransferase n=1 Tax=Methylopila jiangsuensis TaxID=586230 RepID=A0A9W6JLU7_9HYPH|nr:mannose-1-phosphate guanylyltransferase/mannose-6-phosphate isomerase [Methylopila jiangsuensis]MDR6284722.1 mannose-1-phosphate guanylyltransferase/mannose-6-phosphate isomerase [Methylopila jiangsuensis]GLK77888.1 mannose-1-phosphate guanylyltransferase/mannose-6-phosphate isomerase [Methylopila jiangsuensis]